MNDIVSKFTNHLKNVLTRALCLVVETKGEAIEPIHLLWALSTQKGCVAAEILMKANVDFDALKRSAGDSGNIPSTPISHEQNFIPVLSEAAKNVIEKAVLTANVYEHRYVGTEHLLSGIMQVSPDDVQNFFRDASVNVATIQKNLGTVFKTTASFPDFPEQKAVTDALQELESLHMDQLHDHGDEEDAKTTAIDYFTDDMTDEEYVKEFTPVIGRDDEIRRMTKILSRKQKNNPILVGKPGVGKTAIVEGLAKKIVSGNVPPALEGRKILRLDLASMIAGTMYRGEFESRLRQLIDEVADRPEVILFIDEVHTLMGAGAASGSLDASNILKPALARGEIRCIGATTPGEFKKHIEPDGAFERRFQQVQVREPSSEETLEILRGIKPYYEEHHDVKYAPEALERCVELAERYFPGKSFPDKAIDLMDEAGAGATILRKKAKTSGVAALKKELEQVLEEKQKAVVEERFRDAIDLKNRKESLELEISKSKKTTSKKQNTLVDVDIITQTVAEMLEIPVQDLAAPEARKLRALSAKLRGDVIGQNDAVDKVADAVARAKLGLAKPKKPLASFLFLGPSGVGKTLLAQSLAKQLFPNEEAFLRLDMSEYAEPYTISKLIGSPAGYVGYRENTKLTDHVKQNPHCVILFDEIEKAHPDVHNLLLQILDDGMMTDATGRKINFRNAIVIITSNAGREAFAGSGLGFGGVEQDGVNARIRGKLEDTFRPELLNRIEHTCIFNPLDEKTLEKIVKKELKDLQVRLSDREISCRFTSSVAKHIAAQVNAKHGARDVHRVIQNLIEHQITGLLLEKSGFVSEIAVSAKKNHIEITGK